MAFGMVVSDAEPKYCRGFLGFAWFAQAVALLQERDRCLRCCCRPSLEVVADTTCSADLSTPSDKLAKPTSDLGRIVSAIIFPNKYVRIEKFLYIQVTHDRYERAPLINNKKQVLIHTHTQTQSRSSHRGTKCQLKIEAACLLFLKERSTFRRRSQRRQTDWADKLLRWSTWQMFYTQLAIIERDTRCAGWEESAPTTVRSR